MTATRMTIAALALALASSGAARAQETVTIGFAAGLTGYLAFFDGMVRQGAEMAVDEINAAGGLLDGRYTLALSVKDMRSETPAAVIAARELIAEGARAMLVPCDVDPAIAAGQLGQAARIPMISACASTPTLPGLVGDFMFNLKTADNLQAAVLAQYARDQGYATAYVLLSPDTPYTYLLPRYFVQVFERLGGSVVAIGSYSFDQHDFSVEVTRIAALSPQPDVIMTSAYEPHFPAFIRQLRGAGVTAPVLGSDGIDSPTTLGIGPAADGVVFSMAGFPHPGGPLDAFYNAYEVRYGADLPFAFSATGYEAIKLIAAAIEAAGSIEGPAIRDALDAIEGFEGVTGTTITYAGQGRVALRDVTLVEVRDGAQHFIKQVRPDSALIPTP
jgi:branched-chain amino acid transport system substrate-binding protein